MTFRRLLILFVLLYAAAAQAAPTPDVYDKAFVDSWARSGSFGREIGCIIRSASNLENVGLKDTTSGQIIGSKPRPICISAARHEYEGFQIVLSPLPGCVSKVVVSLTDLKSAKKVIPSSNVTVNPVGYVRAFQNQPNEVLVPDPLLIGSIPDFAPGENQPVWITIRVPDDAPAGIYLGNVLIKAAGVKDLQIPVVLRVRNFNIPQKISLRSSFWIFRDQINRFYHLDEVKLDDYLKWIDFALQHRLCPIDVYEGQCKQLLNIITNETPAGASKGVAALPNPKPDFTEWDRYIDHMVAGGASTIHLGQSHHHGGWFADEQNRTSSPVQVQRVLDSLKVLREHYKQRGVYDLHYMQLRDETSEPDSLNVYRDVHKQMPDVKLLLTAPSGAARPMLQIPCPLTPGFDAGWRDEIKANGGEYWWYVCVQPSDRSYANFFLEQTAAQHRVLFWQTWANGVDGLLYWGLNFWSWYNNKWPENAKGPNWRVQPPAESNFCPLPDAPGDGFSMYPGPSPSQPLSSVRLEIMRDGEEDYEYFRILDKLITDSDKQGKDSAALANAKAVRKAAADMVSSMTQYERTGAPYLAMREKVANAIEALSKR